MAPASDTCGCGLASATCVGSDGTGSGGDTAMRRRRRRGGGCWPTRRRRLRGGGCGEGARRRRRRQRGEVAEAAAKGEEAVKGEESGDVLAFATSNRSTTPRPLDTSTRGKMQPRAPIDFIGTSSLGGNATS
uniref:Uncharacterized protein n=1 Tax=Oryza rufipogon TaxID=4529 RepID=A0A0E0RGS8_ORYRU